MKTDQTTNAKVEILIAEDSPTQAAHLAHLLEQHGYSVTTAANGRDALALLERRKPTLVISDIVMSELDGYGLCKAIKADKKLKDIPVMLVTTLSDPQAGVRRGQFPAQTVRGALPAVAHRLPADEPRGAIAPAAVAALRRNAGLSIQQTGAARDLRNKIPGPASRRVTNNAEHTDRGRFAHEPRRPFPTGEINMGYAVIQACEGGEAVELHGRERPDRQMQTVLQALGLEAVAA